MALFTPNYYGKPISEKLEDYLKTFTTVNDRKQAAKKTGVSASTIRGIIYEGNSISENNAVAMLEVARTAIHNCTQSLHKAKQAREFFEDAAV